MRRPLVAGNWKLNGSMYSIRKLTDEILAGIEQIPHAEVAVCPPYVYLPVVQTKLQGSQVALGAQDVSDKDEGAFTGEVSAPMLKEFGVHYCIIGHSERRHIYGEDDVLIARKFAAARRAGLLPILCVGETLEQREQGITEQIIARQLDAIVELVEDATAFAHAVVAYEPVWAIGTGKTAIPDQAQAVHSFIRKRLASQDVGVANETRILYGGSVKMDNAAELFSQTDIDGGLIGGASLKGHEFLAICGAA
jgi:triosephosphate isomerase (TIM)